MQGITKTIAGVIDMTWPMVIVSIVILYQEEVKIGPDVKKGQLLSWTVPAGTIFGSTVKSGYALVSCVVTPAFTFEDFELFTQEQLIKHYPHLEKIIKQLAYE